MAKINALSLPADTPPDLEIDYLEISNVDSNGIIANDAIEKLRFEDAPSRARRRTSEGCTVISSVRPNLQAAAFLQGRNGLICSTGFNVVETEGRELNPKFIYYALISENGRQYFEATAKGVGYPAVDDKDFGSFRVPLPPSPHQERIVRYLDESCARIDATVVTKRQQLNVLSELRRSRLDQAFSDPTWAPERIKDVAVKIGSGVTPEGGSAGYLDDGIPLLRSQNVHFDGLHLDDVAFISAETQAQMSNSQIMPRDVLINITGASIGRCTFVPESFGEANVNQHVCIVRANHRIDHRFLSLFLASPFGQSQVLSSFTGASRQGLSHKELGLISIPLPRIEVQRTTVEAFNEADGVLSKTRKAIDSQVELLLKYRKSLINECITGQRRVPERVPEEAAAYG